MMKQLMIAVAGLHILLSSVPALAQFPSPRVCRANLEARNAQGLSWNADPFWHSPADAAYFNVLGGAAGCSENFGYVQYFNWAFRTPQSSWEAAGYTDACNPNQPYTKAWMAAHLVHKGVNYGGEAPPNYPYPYIRLEPAFHDSRRDYGLLVEGQGRTICRGCSERWHKGYDTHLSRSYDGYGRWRVGNFREVDIDRGGRVRTVRLYCPAFDFVDPPNDVSTGANVGARAGFLVHEAWHARYEGSGRWGAHRSNPGPFDPNAPQRPSPDAPCQSKDCDSFNPTIGKTTPPGGMYHRRMAPYQAELHFQCDVLDSSYD